MENKSELNESLNFIAKSSIFIFIALFLSKLLAYAYKILIARYLGPEIYGIFSLSIIIFSWVLVFSSLGLTDGIVRFISIYRK